jgi:hypothetical protein
MVLHAGGRREGGLPRGALVMREAIAVCSLPSSPNFDP